MSVVPIESHPDRLRRALDCGALAEWSCDLPATRWLVASGLDRLFGEQGDVVTDPTDLDVTTAQVSPMSMMESIILGHLHPADRADLNEAWRRLSSEGETMRVEVRVTRTDGQPRWLSIDGEVSLWTDGEPSRLSGHLSDITELTRLRTANRFLAEISKPLAHLEDYDDTLQRVANDIVPYLADRCIMEFVLPDGSLERIADSEQPRADSPSLPPLHSAPHVPCASLINRIVQQQQTLVLPNIDDEDIRGLSATEDQRKELQEYKPCDYIGTPLTIEGRCFGVLGILTRRDGRRFATQELELVERVGERIASSLEHMRLYTSLKLADERKTQFLAVLSHELRNPLAAISSGLDVIRSSVVASNERNTLAMIDRQADGLTHLLDDLLDVARIDADKLELNREWVSMTQAIDDALSGIASAVLDKRQKLTCTLPVPDVAVCADRVRLEQILVNLLVNASRYTPEGGSIHVGAHRDGERIVLDVSDTGIGLHEDEQQRIFERFEQASDPHSLGNDGLGLGLHLVRALVQLHGGSIEAHSDGKGHGSRFRVTLPHVQFHDQPDRTEVSARDAEEAVTRSIRVLVIDDNLDAGQAIKKVLQRLGHDVDSATTGEEGIHLQTTSPADLVILDIGLPDLDGYGVAARIREHERRNELTPCALVALTGYGQADDREQALRAGFDEHVVKPVRLARLRELVHLPRRRHDTPPS